MAQTPTAFISYRRDDSQDVSGRIYDHLEARFGARQVVKDVDSFQPGADFRLEIDRLIASCDVLLAVIGPNWAGATGLPGQRRIDRPDDFVRIELELALRRAIPIIPLLISGATMPSAATLPAALAPLAYRNALQVRADPDFRRDMDRVIAGIEVNAREAREARQRERQRASKPAPTLAGPGPSAATPLAAHTTVDAPLLPETSARGVPAAPHPRAPRAAASPLRRNSKGILAVAAALLLIAFSTLGLMRFLSAYSQATNATATKTATARDAAQTASAHHEATATTTAFLARGYSTHTPGWACDKGGGYWNPTPWPYLNDDSSVSCASTGSTLIGNPGLIPPTYHSAVAIMKFYGVWSTIGHSSATDFPQNYEVSVHFSALTADSCFRLDARVSEQQYGNVTQGYGFVVCPTYADIEKIPSGSSVNQPVSGSWGSAFTLTAQCVENHLTLLINRVRVVAVDDSAYTITRFLAMYVATNSATTVSATLSDFVFTPL